MNDVSFWLPDGGINACDLYEIVREVGGDIVEQVNGSSFFLVPLLVLSYINILKGSTSRRIRPSEDKTA